MSQAPHAAREPLREVPDLAEAPVVDSVGFPIGRVFGTLIEADSGLVRYLDLELSEDGRHILVPIGHARVLRDESPVRVRLRAATLEDLRTIPPFEPHAPPDDVEQERLLEMHGRVFYGQRYYAHPCFDHDGLYAGKHPILRGPAVPVIGGVVPLSRLEDYRVAPEDDDVRGWPVLERSGAVAGAVAELLVDAAAERVRYVVIDLGHRRIALPTGYVLLDGEERAVRTPALDAADLAELPAYDDGAFDRAEEERVRAVLQARLSGERRFERPDFAASLSDQTVE